MIDIKWCHFMLEETIEVILKRTYAHKEITTNIQKQEMKELLSLPIKICTF